MHLSSIIKIVSLSLLTATTVIARPLHKKKDDGISDNEDFGERDKVAEDPNGAFPATDFSGPEFFPKTEPENERYLFFFRRKRQFSCNGSKCTF
ncbi:hypothetical protein BDP27DRAFT_1324104 [Rhodocollybia butyracea]|uniref:Uncharacterized protein n=1 Tax=Rhodocollybia butyracea TaxID=206335 RepID=A0A9P5U8U1_9AGAR|nr:hypothetical protein BDP27DRAFT_1324104 [Rhodocollybia butyracea]